MYRVELHDPAHVWSTYPRASRSYAHCKPLLVLGHGSPSVGLVAGQSAGLIAPGSQNACNAMLAPASPPGGNAPQGAAPPPPPIDNDNPSPPLPELPLLVPGAAPPEPLDDDVAPVGWTVELQAAGAAKVAIAKRRN
ncbi:hypothetical protein A7982_12312 [Minicystis rosea]|nr:hypothetical protein A7982_12312 [Minicystis rosea]